MDRQRGVEKGTATRNSAWHIVMRFHCGNAPGALQWEADHSLSSATVKAYTVHFICCCDSARSIYVESCLCTVLPRMQRNQRVSTRGCVEAFGG
jgi:hypothetical protein